MEIEAAPLRIALVGNPNCGKTALFNRLTGARQKVANFAGVTVERKEGLFKSASGRIYQVVDLPGAYSLNAATPDEAITREVLFGERDDAKAPDVIVLVVDAANLRLNLSLVLEIRRLQRPAILVLNMVDLAQKRGIAIDTDKLASELGIPVVESVAVRAGGAAALIEKLDALAPSVRSEAPAASGAPAPARDQTSLEATQREVRRILAAVTQEAGDAHSIDDRIDAVVLHPVAGYVILSVLLFLVFQAVFSWSEWPMAAIQNAVETFGKWVQTLLPQGLLRSLIVDGVLSGVGSVLVFLPQILILFFFILLLEESGYLPRAAFLLDRLMGSVGLSGRAFIPLLSSFACAIPGIMATRTIPNPRDRLATIMIAPLMTCSARLPVYALIIGAFIPNRAIGIFNLQGIVLFLLYLAGIGTAMGVAFLLKRTTGKRHYRPLMLELPNYHWPHPVNIALGLWERARIFLTRAGTLILTLMIVLWFLSSFPAPPEGAPGPAIQYSFAGRLGSMLEVIFAPIGFTWQIAIALIPGLAAREVAVGALGTVYALSESGDQLAATLTPMIAATWTLPTALSLLAWYVFAPQCVSTLSVVKRETNSWKPVWIMAGYMFALAYIASFIVYRLSLALS